LGRKTTGLKREGKKEEVVARMEPGKRRSPDCGSGGEEKSGKKGWPRGERRKLWKGGKDKVKPPQGIILLITLQTQEEAAKFTTAASQESGREGFR